MLRHRFLAIAAAALLLGLSAVYLATGVRQNLVVAAPGFTNGIGNGIGTDFPAFYAAALQARRGQASSAYDMDALRAVHSEVRGADVKPYAWAYPPTFLLLIEPLSFLSLPAALWTWLGLTTAALVAGALRIMPSPLAVLLVVLFPAFTVSVVAGPTGTFCAAAVLAGLATLDRRPRLAGLCFGLLTTKPHVALLVPVCLVAARRWTALTAFLAMAAALAAASIAAFGLAPWAELVAALPRHMAIVAAGEARWQRMPTVFAAVQHATGASGVAWTFQSLTTIAVAAACAFVWLRAKDPGTRALAMTAAMPLVGPYAYDYDTAVLVAPILYLTAPFLGGRVTARDVALVTMLWLTPIVLWLGSTAIGQQIGPVLLGAALAEAIRRAAVPPSAAR